MATSAPSPALATPQIVLPPIIYAVLLVVAGSYNGILAVVTAHAFPVTYGMVALLEMALLGLGGLLVIASGLRPRDGLPFALLTLFVFISILMSMGNDYPLVQMIRNVAIVAVFTMLGMRIPTKTLNVATLVLSSVTLAVLCIEIAAQSVYVKIFQPAKYLESSRGIGQAEFNDTGLFANALGFEGRFSFGIFKVPRTSSIFIEQVSLAGFAAVLSIFLLAQWQRLPNWHRVIHTVLIVLILVSNNSRTSTALFVTSLAGYFIFPRLPKYLNFAMAPGLLILSAIFVAIKHNTAPTTDDLFGRLSVTINGLASMDAKDLILGAPGMAFRSLDSGYIYITAFSTIFGMIAYWLFVCMVVPPGTVSQRRTLWGVNAYIFGWLLIGGSATFTIKTAALLWMVAGNARANDAEDEADAKGGADRASGRGWWARRARRARPMASGGGRLASRA